MTSYEMRISDWSSDVCSSYLFEASGVAEGHRVTVDTSADPALVGVELEVQKVDRGEQITERRLYCGEEIGRETWRERACTYVEIWVVDVRQKKTAQARKTLQQIQRKPNN